jgi:hypothetical protein
MTSDTKVKLEFILYEILTFSFVMEAVFTVTTIPWLAVV